MSFPAKINSSCHTCMLNELFYIGMPVVWTDGRLVGRSVGWWMVTWLPNFLGSVDLLSFWAPQAPASSACGAPLIIIFGAFLAMQRYDFFINSYYLQLAVNRENGKYPLIKDSELEGQYNLIALSMLAEKMCITRSYAVVSILAYLWFWSKIPNIFRGYFSLKETLVLSFAAAVYYSGNICRFVKRFCSKIPNIFRAYFSLKETLVFVVWWSFSLKRSLFGR